MGALTSKVYSLKNRPWECKSVESVDILDSMLSNIRIDVIGEEVYRILPISMDDNVWITNKVRYMYDSLKSNRLLRPQVIKNGKLYTKSWYKAFIAILLKLEEHNKSVNFFVDNLINLESVYMSKTLSNSLGIKSVNGLLSGSRAVVPALEKFKSICLVGLNVRLELPVFYYKLRKYIKTNGLNLFLFGIKTSNYRLSFIDLGNSISTLMSVFRGKRLESYIMKKNLNLLTLCSSYLDNSIYNSLKFLVNKNSLGTIVPFSIFSSSIHQLEVGVSNSFLKSRKIMYSLGISNMESNSEYVIYQGHHMGKILSEVDLILPSAVFIEDSSTYIDYKGFVKKTRRVFKNLKIIRRGYVILFGLMAFCCNLNKFFNNNVLVQLSIDEVLVCDCEVDGYLHINSTFNNVQLLDNVNNYYKMDALSNASGVLDTFKKSFKKDYLNNSLC